MTRDEDGRCRLWWWRWTTSPACLKDDDGAAVLMDDAAHLPPPIYRPTAPMIQIWNRILWKRRHQIWKRFFALGSASSSSRSGTVSSFSSSQDHLRAFEGGMSGEETLVEAALRVLNTADPVEKSNLGDNVARWLQVTTAENGLRALEYLGLRDEQQHFK